MLEELTCDGTAARACPAVVSAACLLLEITYIYYELVIAFMLFYGACHDASGVDCGSIEEVEKVLTHGG